MLFKLIKLCELMGAIDTTSRDITQRPHAPIGVAAFMSAHSKTPYLTPVIEFPLGFTFAVGAGRPTYHKASVADVAARLWYRTITPRGTIIMQSGHIARTLHAPCTRTRRHSKDVAYTVHPLLEGVAGAQASVFICLLIIIIILQCVVPRGSRS